MLYLKADTSVKVVIGPVVAVGDGFTPVTTLSVSTADEAEILKHDAGSVTDISSNTFAAITGADGYYNLTITAAQLDTEGMLSIVINDDSLCLPVRHDYMVVNANVYDSLFAAAATDYLQVDNVQISGDSTAADNLELMYDGTGYTDDTAPASREQVNNIGAASGGAVNFAPTEDNTGGAIDPSSAVFVGSVVSGTFASAGPGTSSSHSIDDTTNDIDIVYGYQVGGNRQASSIQVFADVDGVSDLISVKVYDHVGAGWDTIGEISDNTTLNIPLVAKHTGTGSELGKVYIRFETDTTTPANLEVFESIVSAVAVNQSVGYAEGAIWIDGSLSNTNTEDYVDGVADNPVSTLAAAKTLSASLNLNRFRVAAGTSLTLAASTTSEEYQGRSWTLALGGQDITGSYFYQSTSVTGIGTGTNGTPFVIQECNIGASTLDAYGFVDKCSLYSTLTLASTSGVTADSITFSDCFSGVPGSGSPHIDASGVTKATQVNIRRFSGGMELTLTSDCTVSLEVVSGGKVTINGTGGVLKIRGIVEEIVDNSSGAVEVDTAIPNINQVHRGKAQAGSANTITLASTASSTNGQYDPGAVLIVSGTGAGQMRDILGYTGSTKVAEIDKDWRTNPDSTSSYVVFAKSGMKHVNEGQAQAGAATTITLNSAASATDDIYNGQTIFLMGGTGQDQARTITDYNGTTKVATVNTAWQTNPDTTTTYVMMPNYDATESRIPSALVNGKMDSDCTAISGDTVAADRLEAAMDSVVTGTAQTGTLSTTQMTTDLGEATDDHYIGRLITWKTGALAGQQTDITDYAGSSGLLTFTAVTEAPSNGDTFIIT